MSDPEDPPTPASPPTRSIEAARRLSQLLARPLGAPVPPGETPEPYLPRPARSDPPPAPAAEPPHDTASAPPPVAPVDEPDLPWFDRPAPKPIAEPAPASEPPLGDAETGVPLSAPAVAHDEPRAPELGGDDDLFARREPPRDLDEAPSPPASDRVPEWAWPSALERAPEPAPEPRVELGAPPEPLVAPESPELAYRARERLEPGEPARPAPPEARPEETARTLGNIRRLMLVSNLFMVVAIGAVLTVVGYRLFRSEPAPPPPPPVAAPAPAKIPVDMTLTLPRGARIIETAVAGERLVITLEIDGATEIRTFDIKTLQPTGRLSFGVVP
jgi:hypothetical protein